jgi:preprotein translocase subunit SecD
MLWLLAPRTTRSIAFPGFEAGLFGGPPEVCIVTRAPGGGWKIDGRQLLGEDTPAGYFARRLARGEDEQDAGTKQVLAAIERGELKTVDEFADAMQEVKRAVEAATENRRLAAEEKRQRESDAWAASEAGRKEIKDLTAKGTRLELRLVVGPDDPDADDMRADGQAVRVSRTVMLNARAVAKAYAFKRPEAGVGASVAVTLTEAGGRVMERFSSQSIGRRLAIVVDGKAITAPNVNATLREHLLIDVGAGQGFEEAQRIARAISPEKPKE